jgi:hypothetical protein
MRNARPTPSLSSHPQTPQPHCPIRVLNKGLQQPGSHHCLLDKARRGAMRFPSRYYDPFVSGRTRLVGGGRVEGQAVVVRSWLDGGSSANGHTCRPGGIKSLPHSVAQTNRLGAPRCTFPSLTNGPHSRCPCDGAACEGNSRSGSDHLRCLRWSMLHSLSDPIFPSRSRSSPDPGKQEDNAQPPVTIQDMQRW